MDGNSPDTATLYYDDGSISVVGRMIKVGRSYNQTYNLASIVGTAYGRESAGLGQILWCFISAFGILFGLVLFQNSPVMGATIACMSAAILWKIVRGSSRPYVELKFGGLNNQMLFMKKLSHAAQLADAINMAILDMHTPPEPGQPVYSPIFPAPADPVSSNPIFSRN
jgi:hypothetical protein